MTARPRAVDRGGCSVGRHPRQTGFGRRARRHRARAGAHRFGLGKKRTKKKKRRRRCCRAPFGHVAHTAEWRWAGCSCSPRAALFPPPCAAPTWGGWWPPAPFRPACTPDAPARTGEMRAGFQGGDASAQRALSNARAARCGALYSVVFCFHTLHWKRTVLVKRRGQGSRGVPCPLPAPPHLLGGYPHGLGVGSGAGPSSSSPVLSQDPTPASNNA